MKAGDRIINMQNGARGIVLVVYLAAGRPRHVRLLEQNAGGDIIRYLPVSEVEKDPDAKVH